MKKVFLFFALMLPFFAIFGQGIAINTDGSQADISAMLDVKSTTKGLLVPRMTKAQRDAIVTPTAGLVIFQTDDSSGLYTFHSVKGWLQPSDNLGNHTASKNINLNGFRLFNNDPAAHLSLSPNGDLTLRTFIHPNGISPINRDKFKIDNGGGLLLRSDLGIGDIPATGAGDRLMWHPFKSALRAGNADNNCWEDFNIGFYSWAGGFRPIASAIYSFSFGDQTIAAGNSSIAFGSQARALGATAVALGDGVTASGNRSIAIGHAASTNFFTGAAVLADASSNDSVKSTAAHQLTTRYANGYRFFTNTTATIGAQLPPGASSFSSISDSSRKENFIAADAEAFLKKLNPLRLGSWNYKSQDAKTARHYGPMAQEIFAAYGKDGYGTIGCDTLLSTGDMDGLVMILVKGLEERTSQLKRRQIDDEAVTNETMTKQAEMLKSISTLELSLSLLQEQIELLAAKMKMLEKSQQGAGPSGIYKIQKKTASTKNKVVRK